MRKRTNRPGRSRAREMMPGAPIVDVDALFDAGCGPNLAADPRPLLRRADLITVVDHMTRHEALVFGRATLTRIAKGRIARRLRVVRIGVDLETEDLEKVLALVRALRGRHDYSAGPG